MFSVIGLLIAVGLRGFARHPRTAWIRTTLALTALHSGRNDSDHTDQQRSAGRAHQDRPQGKFSLVESETGGPSRRGTARFGRRDDRI
jgi:hypothetical protein